MTITKKDLHSPLSDGAIVKIAAAINASGSAADVAALQANTAALTETSGNASLVVGAGKSITLGETTATEVVTADAASFGTDPTIRRDSVAFGFVCTSLNNYGFTVENTAVAGANAMLCTGGGSSSNQFGAARNFLYDENFHDVLTTSNSGIACQQPIGGNNDGSQTSPLCFAYTTVNFATDANHTASPAEFSCYYLNLTSTGALGATRDLILPLKAGATVYVINGTSGAQSIRAIGASGTGTTIATGKGAELFCDGTNWKRKTADVTP